MDFGKRQLVLAALVVALGAAVYINWQFTDNKDLIATNTVTSTRELGEATYVNNIPSTSSVSSDSNSQVSNTESKSQAQDYFTQARLTRKQAREEAVDTLKDLLEGAKSSEQAKSESIAQAALIAKNIEQEANIENLIKAKGFNDCVAFIQNGECSVAVSCKDGLLESEAVIIKDIVSGQSGISYDKIKIVEVK